METTMKKLLFIAAACLYNPPFQNYNDFSGYFKIFP